MQRLWFALISLMNPLEKQAEFAEVDACRNRTDSLNITVQIDPYDKSDGATRIYYIYSVFPILHIPLEEPVFTTEEGL